MSAGSASRDELLRLQSEICYLCKHMLSHDDFSVFTNTFYLLLLTIIPEAFDDVEINADYEKPVEKF